MTTFTEMLHGDIRAMKQQDAVNRMLRLGKTEMVLLDAEATQELVYHYRTQFALVDTLTMGMGFGKGMQAKREMMTRQKLVAEINGRHPALAAEHRCTARGRENMAVALMELREAQKMSLRDWKKLNWGFYWGRGVHDKDPYKGYRFVGASGW